MDRLEKELRSEDEAEYEDEEVDPRIQVLNVHIISFFFTFCVHFGSVEASVSTLLQLMESLIQPHTYTHTHTKP